MNVVRIALVVTDVIIRMLVTLDQTLIVFIPLVIRKKIIMIAVESVLLMLTVLVYVVVMRQKQTALNLQITVQHV